MRGASSGEGRAMNCTAPQPIPTKTPKRIAHAGKCRLRGPSVMRVAATASKPPMTSTHPLRSLAANAAIERITRSNTARRNRSATFMTRLRSMMTEGGRRWAMARSWRRARGLPSHSAQQSAQSEHPVAWRRCVQRHRPRGAYRRDQHE